MEGFDTPGKEDTTMIDMYEEFTTDTSLETEGIWMDRASYRICIAHAGGGNTGFIKAFERATKPHRRVMAAGRMNDDVAGKILTEAYAKYIVKDWNVLLVERNKNGRPKLDKQDKVTSILDEEGNIQWQRGIHSKDGTVLPYNLEEVIKVLKALPRLFAEIRSIAEEYSNYLELAREEDSKN